MSYQLDRQQKIEAPVPYLSEPRGMSVWVNFDNLTSSGLVAHWSALGKDGSLQCYGIGVWHDAYAVARFMAFGVNDLGSRLQRFVIVGDPIHFGKWQLVSLFSQTDNHHYLVVDGRAAMIADNAKFVTATDDIAWSRLTINPNLPIATTNTRWAYVLQSVFGVALNLSSAFKVGPVGVFHSALSPGDCNAVYAKRTPFEKVGAKYAWSMMGDGNLVPDWCEGVVAAVSEGAKMGESHPHYEPEHNAHIIPSSLPAVYGVVGGDSLSQTFALKLRAQRPKTSFMLKCHPSDHFSLSADKVELSRENDEQRITVMLDNGLPEGDYQTRVWVVQEGETATEPKSVHVVAKLKPARGLLAVLQADWKLDPSEVVTAPKYEAFTRPAFITLLNKGEAPLTVKPVLKEDSAAWITPIMPEPVVLEKGDYLQCDCRIDPTVAFPTQPESVSVVKGKVYFEADNGQTVCAMVALKIGKPTPRLVADVRHIDVVKAGSRDKWVRTVRLKNVGDADANVKVTSDQPWVWLTPDRTVVPCNVDYVSIKLNIMTGGIQSDLEVANLAVEYDDGAKFVIPIMVRN